MASQGVDPSMSTSTAADNGATNPDLSSSPVELSTLQSSAGPSSSQIENAEPAGKGRSDNAEPLQDTHEQPKQSEDVQEQSTNETTRPALQSSASELSPIGPALDLTLMLTTGARHPYRIDEKYLRNRKVEAKAADGSFDPRQLSGYKLKELVWTDWRQEWDPRPASPSSIRLIIMGKLIEDKSALKDLPFKVDGINIVHMTVKPADLIDDDEAGGKGAGKGHSIRGRDGEDRDEGCRCVIL